MAGFCDLDTKDLAGVIGGVLFAASLWAIVIAEMLLF